MEKIVCAMTLLSYSMVNEAVAQPALERDAPAAPVSSSARTHDGFWSRVAAGPVLAFGHGEIKGGGEYDRSGGSTKSSLSGGGIGLVVGGRAYGAYIPTMRTSNAGESNGESASYLWSLGPFVDFYVVPKGGAHFQLAFGYAESGRQSNDWTPGGNGYAAAVGAGYDGWVAEQWSVGLLGQLQYWRTSRNNVVRTLIAPTLMMSVTYH